MQMRDRCTHPQFAIADDCCTLCGAYTGSIDGGYVKDIEAQDHHRCQEAFVQKFEHAYDSADGLPLTVQ